MRLSCGSSGVAGAGSAALAEPRRPSAVAVTSAKCLIEAMVTSLPGFAVGPIVSRVSIAVTSVGQKLQGRWVARTESSGKVVGPGKGGGWRRLVRVAKRVGL